MPQSNFKRSRARATKAWINWFPSIMFLNIEMTLDFINSLHKLNVDICPWLKWRGQWFRISFQPTQLITIRDFNSPPFKFLSCRNMSNHLSQWIKLERGEKLFSASIRAVIVDIQNSKRWTYVPTWWCI